MTISTETVFKRYSGNSSTTAFAFGYHFFEDGDLLVYLEAEADGVATLQVLDTDYTISGADDPDGGTVTFTTAPTTAYTVVIFRKPDLTQTVNLSAFSASSINDALDRLYEHLQYVEWGRSRAIALPDTQADATLVIPFDRASMVVGFDANGDLDLYPAADATAAAASETAAAASAAQALAFSQNPAVSYLFASDTTEADPGVGKFRLNHATLASVTEIYIDNTSFTNNAASTWLDTFDDFGDTNNRGAIFIKGVTEEQALFIGTVTGSVTDGTGYRKIIVTPLVTGGTFGAGDTFSVFFVPRGVDGEVTLALLASTSNGDGASLIGIEDAGGLFTAETVEGALAENRTAIDATEAALPSGAIVGTSDTQTLTNKTLTSPTINAPLHVETLTAGETLADGDLCYLHSDGEMYLADADAEATADTLLAICTEALTDGNPGTFIIRGRYTTSGLTAGSVYYVDVTAGDWSATAPSATGDIVRIVGYALSTTVLLFMPDNTYLEIA